MSGRGPLAVVGSVRLAAWLITVFILMLVMAVVVPQADPADMAVYQDFSATYPDLARVISYTGIDRLFTGWPIIIVSLLLVLNVSACTLRRVLRYRVARPRVGASARWFDGVDVDVVLDDVESELRRSGWAPLRVGRAVVSRRGVLGFVGSVVLHVSLVVMALGGVFTYLSTFSGDLVLTEGQTVIDEPGAYYRVYAEPRIGEGYSGVRLTQGPTDFTYSDGQVVSAVSRLRALDANGNSTQKDVRVNHPLDVSGKSYLLLDTGYAVALLVKTPDGVSAPAVVRLIEREDGAWSDRLRLGDTDLEVLATPIPLKPGDSMPAEKFSIEDPRLLVSLTTSGGASGPIELREGETHRFADGTGITFEELRLWNKYFVRGEPGRWVTYIGFWMSVVGALIRFMVPERTISVGAGRGAREGSVGVAYSCRPWRTWFSDGDDELIGRLVDVAGRGERAEVRDAHL